MNKSIVSILIVLLVLSLGVSGYATLVAKPSDGGGNGSNVERVTAPDQNEPFTQAVEKAPEIELPKGENLALKGKAESNGFTDVYMASYAIDGKDEGASYWEGPKFSKEPASMLWVDLKEPKTVGCVVVKLIKTTNWQKRDQEFSVEVSSDKKTWTEVVPKTKYTFSPKQNKNTVIVAFDDKKVETQYVRLSFTSNTGADAGQVAEFEIYESSET